MPPQELISWTTMEYEEKERHPDWHWYAGLVFALAAVIAFFYGDIFFGILLLVAGAVVIIYAFRKPKELSIVMDQENLSINGDAIPYKRIKQFWLDESTKPDKLLLLVKGSFVPMISIPIAGVAANRVREHLIAFAPEVEMHESTGSKIFDRLGF